MTIQRQVSFWLIALVALVALLFLLSGVLLPFVAGLVLAYLLDPLADKLEKLGMGRLTATLVILVIAVLLLVLALVLLVPLIASQMSVFIAALPDYVKRLQALIAEQGAPLLERFGGQDTIKRIQESLGGLVGQGASIAAGFLGSLLSGGQALLGVISLLVVTPVVAFYLLLDWDDIVAKVDSFVPLRNKPVVRRLAGEIDTAIAGFIRGQALVCLILGLWYGIGLELIGVNFGLMIGLISGFISFVPYVGSLTGLVLALGVAVVQFLPEWLPIVLTLVVFVTGQFVEGNILSPKLVGKSVGLHPVWLMFALFAFGSLFGFVGLLLAVPLAAAVGVLIRFALEQYMKSPLYHGAPVPAPRIDETTDG
jgi:predicted PurR-regulated permease PerM